MYVVLISFLTHFYKKIGGTLIGVTHVVWSPCFKFKWRQGLRSQVRIPLGNKIKKGEQVKPKQ